MKVGWKRQKAFDEYGVSGMKFLIIKLLKNTCITRRIYRLFVCFFFSSLFTITIFLMTITRIIIKCNIAGGQIFHEIFFNLVTRYPLYQLYLHFSFLDIQHFSSFYPKFFSTRTTIIHDIQSYISIITSPTAGLIFSSRC